MRQSYFKPLFFVVFMLFSLNALAWNALGHMVIASIAYQNLKPAVRDKVDHLTASMHQEYPATNTFLDIAFWPDAIRSQKIETFTHWHYIDFPFSPDNTPLKNTVFTDNAVWAINLFRDVIKNESANPYERGRFLAFLVHVVGDLHQPLHTVSEITRTRPDGDKGGNLFVVRYKQKPANLHYIWDMGAGVFEMDGSQDNNANANTLAQRVAARYPASMFTDQIKKLDPLDWTKEGMTLSQKYVYNTPEGQEVSAEYIESTNRLAEQQVALAGYRLAAILNKWLG